MVPSHMLMSGVDAGYHVTYATDQGVLRRRTNWLNVLGVNHMTGVVFGFSKETGDWIEVALELVHTTSSRHEHI